MSEPISIAYKWDEQTYLEAAKSAYDHELKNSNKKYIGWVFIALSQFGVVAAIQKGAIGLLLISTVLIIYWYGLRWPLRQMIIRKTFHKLPNANQNYNITTTTTGLQINNKNIKWDDITGVIALKNGIYINIGQESLYVPNRGFGDIEERSEFLNILKQNITNYIKGE